MRRFFRMLAKTLYFVGTAPAFVFQGLAVLIALRLNRGFLDRRFYVMTNKERRFRRKFPMLDFCFVGNRKLADPNAWFSQRNYLLEHRAAAKYGPVLHFLVFSKNGGYRPGSGVETIPTAASPVAGPQPVAVPPRNAIVDLWPRIRADLSGLRDVANTATPTMEIQRRFIADQRQLPFPSIGRHATAIVDAIPEGIRHLVVVPWLGLSGGSEKVTERVIALLREHYADGELCIFAPEQAFELPAEARTRFGVKIVAINDFAAELSQAERTYVFDRVMIERRPATVHCINSLTGWIAFREKGHLYRRDSNLYANIYSDIRLDDGMPVGFFWQFLPQMTDVFSGVFADNEAVIRRARECFGLTDEQMGRFHVIRTPILGLDGARAPYRFADMAPGPRPKRTLWMSRISVEKRLDVLQKVATETPDRQFDIFGAVLKVAQKVDMSWTHRLSNVSYRGEFESLSDIVVEDYDSYMFTTRAEGMPIALLEAALLGLPIVAPNVGGIGEFIREDTGWLVSGPDAVDEYRAALEHIRRDPAEARRRAEAARRLLVERHSWEAFSSTLHSIPGYMQPVERERVSA